MQDAVAVANFFVAQALAARLRDLTAPKLHELVYCAHGWHLAMVGQALVTGKLLATRDGPRVEALAEEVRGTRRVLAPITVNRKDSASGTLTETTPQIIGTSENTQRVLGITWKAYGKLSGYDLSLVTREQGGPWDLLWNDDERTADIVPMPNETIRMWFRALAERNRKVTEAKSVRDTQRILITPDNRRTRSN